jgi:hypothetical protein
MKRRQLLILLLGFAFLIALTFMGTSIESIVAFLHPTHAIQQGQAGPYQVILQVAPNPPAAAQPTDLTLQIVHATTQQLLTNAHVWIESDMESMDMGTDRVSASPQSTGTYVARVQFGMSGLWQVEVVVAVSGKQTESAAFTIVVQ